MSRGAPEAGERPNAGRGRAIEAAIFVASLAIVLGTLIALVVLDRPWEARQAVIGPTVTAGHVAAEGRALVIHLEVHNQGHVSVEEVVIEVAVPGADEPRVQLTVRHLPAGATRRAVAVLHEAPAGARPEARVLGYQLPN